MTRITIGLGGGCHWCTEAIFSSLSGIHSVQQGWLSSLPPYDTFSEGVLLEIEQEDISLSDLVDIHIQTHSADAMHSLREKYRSAIYVKNKGDLNSVSELIQSINQKRQTPVITQVLILKAFKLQDNDDYLNYYYKRADKPFCQAYINPKLKKLLETHANQISEDKLSIIKENLQKSE